MRKPPKLPKTNDSGLNALFSAFKEHKNAWHSFEDLVLQGCKTELIFFLLYGYQISFESDPFVHERRSPSRLRRSLKSTRRKLSAAKRELHQVDSAQLGPLALISSIAQTGLEKTDSFLEDSGVELKRLSDGRGPLRREIFLVLAIDHIKGVTGKRCYKEVATILECFAISKGRNEIVDPDAIRKIYERYIAAIPELPTAALLAEVQKLVNQRLGRPTSE